MKSLKHVYENSNFYKEARIVSFIDRLLACVQNKIKTQCSIGFALLHGSQGIELATVFLKKVDTAK